MPYLSCHFDVVTASQTLHHFAPGLAVTEIARVLRPGGHLAVVYQTRDDTVPWVRRLMTILQRVDPSAMQGAYGDASVQEVGESPYFHSLERRDFRAWVPTTREGLVTMAARRSAVAALPPAEREDLLAEVGGLYDSSARAPEPLLLPFRTSCWRAAGRPHRAVDRRGPGAHDRGLTAAPRPPPPDRRSSTVTPDRHVGSGRVRNAEGDAHETGSVPRAGRRRPPHRWSSPGMPHLYPVRTR